jgi:hypothetical protein
VAHCTTQANTPQNSVNAPVLNSLSAATGSWTRPLQYETHRTWFRSAGATVVPSANVSGVRPSNDAWPCRVVVGLKLGKLPFKITAIPEQHMVQEFSARRPNQALHERVG